MAGTSGGFRDVGAGSSVPPVRVMLRLVADGAPQDLLQAQERGREARPDAWPVETAPCTWTPTCTRAARHRMERRDRPDLTVVETVCDEHREAAEADGYVLREPGYRRASPGSGPTRDPPPG